MHMNRSIILISFCDGPFEGFSDHSAIILYVLNKIIRMDVNLYFVHIKSSIHSTFTRINNNNLLSTILQIKIENIGMDGQLPVSSSIESDTMKIQFFREMRMRTLNSL
jgi:hypothetical protein